MRLLSDGGKITIKTGLDNSGIEKDLAAMSSLIKGSTAVIGAAMAAATTAVVGFGSAYETSMAKASTLFGDVAVDTENLNGKILKLSGSSGKAATELNETLYQALSAGVPVTEDMGLALNAVETASKLATSGFTTSASAIDVMTTAANAYSDAGYEMSEISDILLMTQNKGKTTVDELASSLGRVLPVASAYCVSLEDVGAAEATMTANGIATAESTTYLKGMLNELGDSGSGVSKILQEKTGMAFAQLMEAGYSLGDVMQILQDSVNGDATAFANLWSSQEAGVGALSIANTGAQAYNETLKEMQNSAGTTEDAYSKMSDTLEFKGNQMKETAKNLAISVYNDLEETIKGATDVGTAALGDLQSALSSPKFKKATESIAKGIMDFAKAAGNVAKSVLPLLGKILGTVAKNLKTFATVALSAVAAIKTFQAAIGIVNALNGAISTMTTIMNANPIFLVVTAVAALASVVGVATAAEVASTEAAYGLSEAQQELCDKIDASYESMQQANDARQANINAIGAEYGQYQTLAAELRNITDANGQVKAGYEERAAVITGILSDALGTEITMTDGVIDNYGELMGMIDQVIQKKQVEALLTAYQEDYANALTNSTDQLNAYNEAVQNAANGEEEIARLTREHKEAQDQLNQKTAEGLNDNGEWTQHIADLEAELEAATDNQKELNSAVEDAKTVYENSQDVIQTYGDLQRAAVSGSAEEVKNALNEACGSAQSYQQALDAAGGDAQAASQAIVDSANTCLTNLQMVQSGEIAAAEETKAQLANNTAAAIAEFGNLSGGVTGAIQQMGPDASAAMVSALATADMKGQLSTESQEALQSFINGFSGLDSETQAVWSQAWYGALAGLEGFEQLADPAKEGADTFLESLKAALEVHSPSAAAEAIFAQVWPGASQGLDQGKEELSSKGSGVISEFLTTLGTGVSGAQDIGSSIMSMFGLGISSQAGNSHAAGAANASAAQAGAGSIDPSGIGGLFGTLFGSAISGASGTTGAAGLLIATAAQKAAGGVNPSNVGRAFTSTFGGAIGASGMLASIAAKGVASTAKGLLESVSTASSGNMFGSGFSAGIRAMVGSAVDAASSLASAALSTIKNVLDIHSPSRATRNFGRLTGAGLALGIEDKMAEIKSVASKLSRAALDGMNVEALATKMTAAVKESNIATSSGIAANIRHTVEKEQEDGSRLEERLDKMVSQFIEALGNLTLKYKEREVARMVKEVMN